MSIKLYEKLFLIISIIFFLQSANAKEFGAVKIFACTPEWGALAQEIVGKTAAVVIATNQFQNPHFIRVKPSLIADIRNADIVFCSGSDLEIGWLPVLLKKGGNKEIQVGGNGYLMASNYVKKLEVPAFSSAENRSKGDKGVKVDIHPFGNPHIHLNPHNIPPVASELLKRLIKIDPENAKIYQANYGKFIRKWNLAIIKWEKRAKILKDMPIIVKHNHWAYLVDWLELKVVATLEEKPGIEPSRGYLTAVLQKVQNNKAKMIIYAPSENKTSIFWFSDKSQTKAVLLPFTIYGTAGARNIFGLFDDTLNILIKQSQSNFSPNKSLIKI